jgi:hypothetical protein
LIKEFKRTSASQIKTFLSCKRKWYRESILGERADPGKGALLGQAIHKELEDHFIKGSPLKSPLAKALYDQVPKKNILSNQVEVEFEFTPDQWPVPVKGYVDLVLDDLIIDHKTTSDFQFALNENTARFDPQVLIYCGAGLGSKLTKQYTGSITFALNYVKTKGMLKTQTIAVTLTEEEVKSGLLELAGIVKDQQKTAVVEAWDRVEPNYSQCDKYGGCPFRSECVSNNKPKVKEVIHLTKDISDFKAMLEKRRLNQIGELSQVIDLDGSQYENPNPPDGVPDSVVYELPGNKKRTPKYNGKSINSLKVSELKTAILEHTILLSTNQLNMIEGYENEQALNSNKKEQNKQILIQMIEMLENPKEEKMIKRESNNSSNDLFWSLANVSADPEPNVPCETISKDPEPNVPHETISTDPEPNVPHETISKDPEPNVPHETISTDPEPNVPHETISTDPKMLLIDAHCTGAYELEKCLYPLIIQIQHKYKMPISVIKYAEGWKELAGIMSTLSWEEMKLPKIIRIDSHSALWAHCSHVIIPLANHVIRGTR